MIQSRGYMLKVNLTGAHKRTHKRFMKKTMLMKKIKTLCYYTGYTLKDCMFTALTIVFFTSMWVYFYLKTL